MHSVMADVLDIFTNISADISPTLKENFEFLDTKFTLGFDAVIREVCTLTGVSYIDSVPEKLFGPWQAIKNTHDILYGIALCKSIAGIGHKIARHNNLFWKTPEKSLREKNQDGLDRAEDMRERKEEKCERRSRHTDRIAVVDLSHSNLYSPAMKNNYEKDHLHMQTKEHTTTNPLHVQNDSEMNVSVVTGTHCSDDAVSMSSSSQGKCRNWPYISKTDQTNLNSHQMQSISQRISKCRKRGNSFRSQKEMEINHKKCNSQLGQRTIQRERLRYSKQDHASSSSNVDLTHYQANTPGNPKRLSDETIDAVMITEDVSDDIDDNEHFVAASRDRTDTNNHESLSNCCNYVHSSDSVDPESLTLESTATHDVLIIKSEPFDEPDLQNNQEHVYPDDDEMNNTTENDAYTRTSVFDNSDVSLELDEDGNEHQPFIVQTFPAQTKYCCASCSYTAKSVKQINTHVKRIHSQRFLCEESNNDALESNELLQTNKEIGIHDVQIKSEPPDDSDSQKQQEHVYTEGDEMNSTTDIDAFPKTAVLNSNITDELDLDGNEHQPYTIRTFPSETKYCCASCSYSANSIKQISDHVKRVHYRRFLCEVCPARFGLKKDLTRHYRKTHKLSIEIKRRGRGKATNLPTLLGLLSK